MRILIDTHVLIWYLNGDEKLSPRLIKIIDEPTNLIVISVASLWELTIKLSSDKNKIKLDISLGQIRQYINAREVEILDIEFDTLLILLELPNYHSDPFDRLMISQAIKEDLPIISVDRFFKSYPINVIQ